MPTGTPGIADFSIFTVRSAVEDVLQGVYEILRADQELAPFLGASEVLDGGGHSFNPKRYGTDGRIVEIQQQDFLPDLPTPFCALYLQNEQGTLQPNGDMEIVVPVVVRLVWDVLDEVTDTSEKGCATFFNRCRYAILSDQRLENTSISQTGRGLADLSLGFQTILWQGIQTTGSDYVTMQRDLVVSYRITVNAKTGQPAYR